MGIDWFLMCVMYKHLATYLKLLEGVFRRFKRMPVIPYTRTKRKCVFLQMLDVIVLFDIAQRSNMLCVEF